MKRFRKPILWVFLSIGIILTSLVFVHFISLEKEPVSKDWSREFDLNLKSDDKTVPFQVNNEDSLTFYTSNNEGINSVTLDDDYKILENQSIKLDTSPEFSIWTNGKKFLYVNSKNELHHYIESNNKDTVIDDNITGYMANKNTVVYWKDKSLFTINPVSMKTSKVKDFDKRINRVVLEDQSLLVITNEKQAFDGTLLIPEKEKYRSYEVFAMETEKISQRFTNFDYILEDENMELVYTIYDVSEKAHTPYYLSGTITKLHTKKPKTSNFYPAGSNVRIENPNYLNIYQNDGKVNILFSAQGRVSSFKTETNVFNATLNDNKWKANQLSRTANRSSNPFQFEDGKIFWQETQPLEDAKVNYSLMGITTDKDGIARSKEINKDDIKTALSHTGLALAMGIMTLLVAMVWVTPAGIFIMIMYMFNTNAIEQGKRWVLVTTLSLYFITQLFIIQMQMNDVFYMFAPDYLIFDGSSYILPFLIGAISVLIIKMFRISKDHLLAKLSYTIAMNVLIVTLLIGPYRF
ncbi:hypothetical protein [Guptibacillus spartinae]|uniref:hypothetical protein n=1 Tax=Guptibacillus spartinae TaxID=3025679 RepID=UPI00235F3773|nr:hypothetical protein [Pseudalkalibacillus spartinae]